MFLLDTDTLVFMLRGQGSVEQHLRSHAGTPKAISVISYGELLYGAMRSGRAMENLARVRRLPESLPVVDVSMSVMETFGQIKVDLEKSGRRVDDFDLLIASTALMMNYALVTNNTRHFMGIPGLRLDNWAR